MLEPVDLKKQTQILLALVTYLLDKKSEDTPERALLKLLSTEKHDRDGHEGPFFECRADPCSTIVNILSEQVRREVTIKISDLKDMKKFQLHYGSRLAGTVTAWLEVESLIQVAR